MNETKSRSTIETELAALRETHDLPALAASVVQASKTVEIHAVGRRRRDAPEPVTTRDLWHLGSCTKAMTATMIAVLVEEGALTWRTTIAESFPDLLSELHPGWHGISLEQLLSHRSGLPEDREPDAVLFPKVLALRGPLREQRRQLVGLVLKQTPVQPPNTGMLYSNYGYAIAGAMAEQAAQDSWENLLGHLLFEPLGMESAGFGSPGNPDALSQPRGHLGERPVEPGARADNPAVLGPAGTVHCSLADFGKFAALHVAGARGETTFLDQKTFAWMHRPRGAESYALGWGIGEQDSDVGPTLSHAGSNGMWTAIDWLSPPRDLACLVATNAGGDHALTACAEAIKLLATAYLDSD